MICQIGVAALLAGLACGPAWAQTRPGDVHFLNASGSTDGRTQLAPNEIIGDESNGPPTIRAIRPSDLPPDLRPQMPITVGASIACPPKVGSSACVTIDAGAAKTITFSDVWFGPSDAPPPATNLDAAWQVCEKHLNDEVNATHAVVQDDFSVPCGRVEMLLNDHRNADAAAKAKIDDAADLAVIERGIDHPNERPPR